MRRSICFLAASAVFFAGLTGCGGMQLGRGKKKVVLKDFAEGRVVQVAITDRLTGAKEMLFLSMPKKSLFLEGYIQGVVTDYDDNPVEGVVVRAQAKGEKRIVEKGQAAFQTSAFQAGVSDSNGIYRIRFSLPIIKNKVDIRGKLQYNPGWDQDMANLGRAYKPQKEESPFRLHFDMKEGMLVFAEGIQKVVVKPVFGKGGAAAAARTGGGPQRGTPPAGGGKKEGEGDLFKAFFGE